MPEGLVKNLPVVEDIYQLIEAVRDPKKAVRELLEDMEPEAVEALREALHEIYPTIRASVAPHADVYKTDKGYRIVVELPGADPDSIDVKAYEDRIEVAARIPKRGEGTPIIRETITGEVRRTFQMPKEIIPDEVEAVFEHGVLVIDAPIVEEKPVKVEVKTP